MKTYSLEHVCSYSAQLAEPEVIGPVPEGLRVNFYVTDGEVTGPKLTGKVRPVGGDWLTLRTDGVAILDVRATIETDDGALIGIAYRGVGDLGETGYQDFIDGKLPPRAKLHTAPLFTTAHPDYKWLNRLQCINIGEVDFSTRVVSYDTYALR